MSEPIPVMVRRYMCPHCSRGHSKKAAAVAHIARCWLNQENRTCKTCVHFDPGYVGMPCFPGRWCDCNDKPDECHAGIDLSGKELPVTHCPRWEAPCGS